VKNRIDNKVNLNALFTTTTTTTTTTTAAAANVTNSAAAINKMANILKSIFTTGEPLQQQC
jgi:hypothetical protein